MSPSAMSLRVARWAIVVTGGLLVLLAIIAGAGSRTAALRQLVIDTLADRLDSEVQLEYFSVDTFPTVHVTGTNLIIRHKGRKDVPPLVSVQAFELDGGLIGLLSRPRRFRTASLTGLQINIPPGFHKEPDTVATTPADSDSDKDDGPAAILVDTLRAKDAQLTLIPRKAGKQPRVFAVHVLTVKPLGRAQAMSFEATITNPIPKGLVIAKGTFGPWRREDPGATPVGGEYTFNNVDLSTVKGIGGWLTSTGNFGGQLDRIAVKGTTHTPDFRVNVSSNPVPLDTKFDALVDGTDGDTYLNAVDATFLQTGLSARGAIVGAEGVKGRTIQLHVKINDGRIEDVLRLGVKGNPVMTGSLALHADMNLPAGPGQVIDRLHLAGTFHVADARFNNAEIQSKLSDLSERARGLDPDEHATRVTAEFLGQFTLANNVLSVRDGSFTIPGALVKVGGTYDLDGEGLQFDGTVRMKATISQAAGGGVKAILLKVVDPLFRRDGAGAVVPITIRGTRSEPKFGLDVGRTFRRQ